MYRWLVLAVVVAVICGCNAAGCGGDTATDGGMGKDIGPSDAQINDTGTDTGLKSDGGDAAYDSGYTTHPYDYDPGTDPNPPFGSEFEYIGRGGLYVSLWGDYVVWDSVGKAIGPNDYQELNDVCYRRVSTGESKCLGVNYYKGKYERNDSAVGDVYIQNGKIVWTVAYNDNEFHLNNVLFYLDLSNNEVRLVFETYKSMVTSHGVNDDSLVFEILANEEIRLYRYRFLKREIIPLKTDIYAAWPINQSLWMDGNDLVFHCSNDNLRGDYYYNLLIDELIKLGEYLQNQIAITSVNNGHAYGWGGEELWDAASWDLLSSTVEVLYKSPNGVWFPKICMDNVMLWEEGGVLTLFDIQTKYRRPIKMPVGDYAFYCGGPNIVVTPDKGTYNSRLYLFQLEKHGYVKDGHVVPENDGGVK